MVIKKNLVQKIFDPTLILFGKKNLFGGVCVCGCVSMYVYLCVSVCLWVSLCLSVYVYICVLAHDRWTSKYYTWTQIFAITTNYLSHLPPKTPYSTLSAPTQYIDTDTHTDRDTDRQSYTQGKLSHFVWNIFIYFYSICSTKQKKIPQKDFRSGEEMR